VLNTPASCCSTVRHQSHAQLAASVGQHIAQASAKTLDQNPTSAQSQAIHPLQVAATKTVTGSRINILQVMF
jgi:hypothetical protein